MYLGKRTSINIGSENFLQFCEFKLDLRDVFVKVSKKVNPTQNPDENICKKKSLFFYKNGKNKSDSKFFLVLVLVLVRTFSF